MKFATACNVSHHALSMLLLKTAKRAAMQYFGLHCDDGISLLECIERTA